MDTVLPAAPPSTEISMVASGQGKSDLPGRNVVLNAKLRLRIWFKLWENGSMQVTGVEWLKAREWLRQYKPEPPRRQSHTATNRKTTTGGNLITIFQKGRLTLKNIDNLSISLTWFQVQFKSKLSKQRSVVLAKLSNSKTRPGSIVVTTNPKTHSVVFAESYTTPGATSAVLAFSPHRRDAYHRWHVWPKSRWSTAPAIYSCHDFPLEKTPRIKSCQFLKSLWLEHGGCN